MFTICTERSNMGCETASVRITLLDQRWFTKTATLRGRTSTEIYERCSLFWAVTLRTFVVTYRRFGKTYQPPLQGSSSPELRNSNSDSPPRHHYSTTCSPRCVEAKHRHNSAISMSKNIKQNYSFLYNHFCFPVGSS